MTFSGFNQMDFDTFSIEGLDARMEAIRERIQPKFKALGEALCDDVAISAGHEMFLHIAKHARRKTNPPKDTWLAICHNKRGYKQHPHFQIGLFDDHVFIWFALIYEMPNKQSIAEKYLKHVRKTKSIIPSDYVLSFDHTKKESILAGHLKAAEFKDALVRFRDVKKAEFLVGRHIKSSDTILKNSKEFIQLAKETFETLIPLYKMACE